MNYAFIAVGLLAVLATVVLTKKSVKAPKIEKILSLVLFGLFAVRYLSYYSNLEVYTLAPKGFSDMILAPSPFGSVLAFAFEWLSLSAMVLLLCRPYFTSKTLNALCVTVAPVYCVLALAGYPFIVEYSANVAFGDISYLAIIIGVEIGVTTALTLHYLVRALKEKGVMPRGRSEVLIFVLCLVLALLACLPNFTLKFLFGATGRNVTGVKSFGMLHRIFIYGVVAVPIVAYFALRNRSRDNIRLVLVYFSLAAMFVYCYSTTFEKLFTQATSWPLHLCNTAMFLVPLCLIFKTQKLFYFTYFINVFGALVAMLLPNYDDFQMLTASETVRFWYNHYCAFFMPLLLVSLKLFDRPTIKQFRYSILGFCMYFVFALLMNVICNAFGHPTDYFFLMGDHIAGTLGKWAENIYNVTASFEIAGHVFLFRPLYQSLFFVIYVGLGLSMWFIYELGFSLSEALGDLLRRDKQIKLDQYALMSTLNGRSIEEPMNKDAGIKLELKGFSKRYATNKKYAVKDANLEVYGGEIFGFLGPNGAGKSTIIKSIVGIQPITEGAIEVCGYDCAKQPVQAKREIGYVPDHYALYEKLTGREYINYIADIYDVSEADRRERIERHIEMFELQGAIDMPIKTYSHGMKQKITIMAALVHEPKLWILDEPLTGLDPNSIHQVKECMKAHAAKGNIVFFSSHIIDVVERICDRITIIKKGTILVTRDVADIEKEGPLEEYYLKTINGGSIE